MKASQLKALVKEIVRQVMDSKQTQPPKTYEDTQGWSYVKGNDRLVEFEDVLLKDGREVNIYVEFDGSWDDGAFDYEYGSIRGTHRYPPSFEIGNVTVTYAEDYATKQRLPLDQAITAAGEELFDRNQRDIIEGMPEPDTDPDPPYDDSDLDR